MTQLNRGTNLMATPNFSDKTVWTGDNLDILRGFNSDCVDLIYLDPPFNSNRNYAAPLGSVAAGAAFKDTWTLSDLDAAWMGLIADERPAMYQVLQTAGLTHGKGMQSYLCMMAVRLLEMRRVLKDTGSIYLHCDPTASHYLKLLMDSIYGCDNFMAEITWKRTSAHNDSRSFGNINDTILFYGGRINVDAVRIPLDPDYVSLFYRYEDDRGLYRLGDLTAAEIRYGETGKTWKEYDPTSRGRHWAIPRTGDYAEWVERNLISDYKEIISPLERLDALDEVGLIHHPNNRGGMPQIKRYLDANPGQIPSTLWDDIPPVAAHSKERVGYPTQKPLALLERIIRASSNEGDVVLDPFCGCATACVAAENLGRRWVGIDISPKAVELVNMRLKQTMGELFHNRLVTARTDIPRRTDILTPIPYRQNKHVLFGKQEGRCNGCRSEFPFRNLTIDHIMPVSRGGTDHIENLQLLCGHCNSVKGDRPQEFLVTRLRELGIAA